MNVHKNARLTFVHRLEMIKGVLDQGLRPAEAAAAVGTGNCRPKANV